jgi:GTP diphosphokinase / guanosine-3',5'-bis(diphosphate) 3'-diphosphatase
VPTSSLDSGVRKAHAIQFVIEAYDGVSTRPGKGLPHAQAVADVLRNADCGDFVQVVALLHDVVEDTSCTVDDVRAEFGDEIAGMVDALTEDGTVKHYQQRKRLLRSRIVAAGSTALDISLADKIATLRHALVTGSEISRRKLTHYRATLQLGLAAGGTELLCIQLEDLLSAMARRG